MEAKLKILIVDDKEIIRDILFDLFRDEGFEPVLACNVVEAVQKAQLADCIILDRKLSVSSDDEGGDLLRRLWSNEHFNKPIIIFSGYIYSGEVDEALSKIEIKYGKGRSIARCVPKSGGFRNLIGTVNDCLTKLAL